MRAEFELSINECGDPIIKFRHHDKSSAIEQLLLKVFVTGAKNKGIVLKNPSGYLKSGTTESWENYEIHLKK